MKGPGTVRFSDTHPRHSHPHRVIPVLAKPKTGTHKRRWSRMGLGHVAVGHADTRSLWVPVFAWRRNRDDTLWVDVVPLFPDAGVGFGGQVGGA